MRIIAGSARGRTIEAPKGRNTRPTLDRVKEALFGAIQFDIPGATVLDLFSGSGNLGLEALSRGASRVIMNDSDRACANLIRQNAEKLGFTEGVSVWQLDYQEAISRAAREGLRFDFVFIDAPYFEGLSEDAAIRLFAAGCIKETGLVIIESAANQLPKLPNQGIRELRTRRYGDCALTMWKGEND